MSYQIDNPDLRAAYERYQKDSVALRDLAGDVALLRALIERSVAENQDSPTKSLKVVEGSLAVLLRLESKLLALDIERAHVLEKTAILALADKMVSIISDSLRRHAPDAHYAVVDELAPMLALVVAEARNDPA